MINHLFLPNNSPLRKKTPIKISQSNLNIQKQKQNIKIEQPQLYIRQFKIIHQLDCIYQGQINQSYKKQGFGIQQTNNFQIYLGFWKNGKINGHGMIIYPLGYIIYGNFKDNQLQGIVISDDKISLKVFNYYQNKIIGVGYQYKYAEKKWKFLKYHKGVPIETLSSAQIPLEKGIPSMFNINEDFYLFLNKYLSQDYFDCSYKNILQRPYKPYTEMNIHHLSKDLVYFGQMIEGKHWGIGVIYDKTKGQVKQTGFYENNQFNGYAMQIDQYKNKIQIGLFNKGKKDGFFYQKVNHLQTIIQYEKNYMRGQRPELNRKKIFLVNNQKIFNYQKNDYFSEKNKIKFSQYLQFFQNSQIKLNDKVQQLFMNNRHKTDKKEALTPKKYKKQSTSPKKQKLWNLGYQNSTVGLIREKFQNLQKMIKNTKKSLPDQFLKQKEKRKQMQKQILNQTNEILNNQTCPNITISKKERNKVYNEYQWQDQQVLQQEQPVIKSKNQYKTAKKYRLFENLSPLRNKGNSEKINICQYSANDKRKGSQYQNQKKVSRFSPYNNNFWPSPNMNKTTKN